MFSLVKKEKNTYLLFNSFRFAHEPPLSLQQRVSFSDSLTLLSSFTDHHYSPRRRLIYQTAAGFLRVISEWNSSNVRRPSYRFLGGDIEQFDSIIPFYDLRPNSSNLRSFFWSNLSAICQLQGLFSIRAFLWGHH